jgi:hypothetical protein
MIRLPFQIVDYKVWKLFRGIQDEKKTIIMFNILWSLSQVVKILLYFNLMVLTEQENVP